MKIFILGSTGFIGSNILNFFSKHTVWTYIKSSDNLKNQLNLLQPDWIINCAAEIYQQDLMWESNVTLVKDCLEWLRNNPYCKMIHMGSSSEYGSVDRPTNENDPVVVTDMYGTTKGISTHLCTAYAKTYGLDVVTVRPYSPFGPGERPRRLFPKLWLAFKRNIPMQLVEGVHDFCYIDDFVSAIDTIMQSKNRKPGDIINVSSGIQSTNSEVLECFRSITKQQGCVTQIDKFCTPKVWQADISYVKQHYGWKPSIDLYRGIELFLEKAKYEPT